MPARELGAIESCQPVRLSVQPVVKTVADSGFSKGGNIPSFTLPRPSTECQGSHGNLLAMAYQMARREARVVISASRTRRSRPSHLPKALIAAPITKREELKQYGFSDWDRLVAWVEGNGG